MLELLLFCIFGNTSKSCPLPPPPPPPVEKPVGLPAKEIILADPNECDKNDADNTGSLHPYVLIRKPLADVTTAVVKEADKKAATPHQTSAQKPFDAKAKPGI